MVAYKSFERNAWDMLMVANSLVVIILNNFVLPITEEVRVGASQRTISAYESFSLQSLSDKSNGVSQCWS